MANVLFTEQTTDVGANEEAQSDTEDSQHSEVAPSVTSPLKEISFDQDTSQGQTGSRTSQTTHSGTSLENEESASQQDAEGTR